MDKNSNIVPRYYNQRTKEWQETPDEDTVEIVPDKEDLLLFGLTEEKEKEKEKEGEDR